MKKNKLVLTIIIFFLVISLSCGKQIPNGSDIPRITLLQSWISDGPWNLLSATRYNTSGMISRYRGNAMDTLTFGITSDLNGNVVRTGAGININGVYTICPYQLNLLDTTVTLGPSCRPNYNDTIYVNYFSEDLMVLKMKFDSADIHYRELDSLKKMYFTNP